MSDESGLSELEPLSEEPVPTGGRPSVGGTTAERPPFRELDQAPQHLKMAAAIVFFSGLLPWAGHGGGPLVFLGAKAGVVLGLWLWLQQIDNNWDGSGADALKGLAKADLFKPRKAARPRRAKAGQPVTSVSSHFPTALHVLALLTLIGSCIVLPLMEDGYKGAEGPIPLEGMAMAELCVLAWAGGTMLHLRAYERWGPFNPIFPMMFLAFAIGGLFQAGMGLGSDSAFKIFQIVGGTAVSMGGAFAVYTIGEAMVAAKKEGNIKKAAALEARRAARSSRSSNGN